MIVNAQQGNAPQSLIDKARKVLESGGKRNDVSNILGKYGLTLADRLDLEIKRKTLDKLEQELNKSNPDFGELVKINGKDYIRYKDGTISEPVLPEAKDTEVVVSRLDNKIKEIDRLTAFNGGVGLATSAGSLRGAPIPFLFKGKINDWRANIKNLTSKLTVDELGRVKSDGVTFGQLSNGERLAVGEAATALNAAMITRGSGDDKKATGRFKMSEPEVLRQLNIIKDAYLLDFERRTGVNYAEYQANPDVLKNKLADEFIDKYETALEVNNYGGYPID
jgi:DNA-binding transcriptional ArsR family regulator